MKIVKRDVLLLVVIWVITLAVLFTGMRPYGGGDAPLEVERIRYITAIGWHPTWVDHNNSSVALALIAPYFVKTFNISPVSVCRDIFPFLFALTPCLLYLLFRRIMSPFRAFLSAMFFAVLPPTYQEIPNIAKSMLAQPVAAGTLLVLTSKIRFRVIIGLILALLTVSLHYTIGIFLIAWMGAGGITELATYKRKGLLIVTSVVAVMAISYLSVIGGGSVVKAMVHAGDRAGIWNNDNVVKVISGEEVQLNREYTETNGETETVVLKVINISRPLHLPFNYSSRWITVSIYLAMVVLLFGGLFWIVNIKILRDHYLIASLILLSGVLVICAFYTPLLTGALYFSRWVQIASIPMCGLYGMATHWLSRKVSYPIASFILLVLLVVAR